MYDLKLMRRSVNVFFCIVMLILCVQPDMLADIDVDMILNTGGFVSYDHFKAEMYLNNHDKPEQDAEIFGILEIMGEYYFWPSFSPEVDYEILDIPSGGSYLTFLEFDFPNIDAWIPFGPMFFWGAWFLDMESWGYDVQEFWLDYDHKWTPTPVPATSTPTTPPGTPTITPTSPCGPGQDYIELVKEDFSSWPLTGWTIFNNGGDCIWRAGSDGDNDTNKTGGIGDYADADSDECGPGTTMDTELLTPSFDLTGVTAATLEFKSDMFYYAFGGDEYWRVDVSSDGGMNWTNILDRSGENYPGPETIELDLSSFLGARDVKVRFHYYGQFDWWWQVDDVWIWGCEYQVPTRTPTQTPTAPPGIPTYTPVAPTPTPTATTPPGTPTSTAVPPTNTPFPSTFTPTMTPTRTATPTNTPFSNPGVLYSTDPIVG
ncbi:hypothetical protein JW979_05925, partial [bacterium]|nr:hypothetical protein [candidate division CSSED10-310 bacterium]